MDSKIGVKTLSLVEEYERHFAKMSPMGADFDPHLEQALDTYSSPFRSDALAEAGCDPCDLLNRIFPVLAQGNQKPGHPRYFAYLAGSGDPYAVWAQTVALTLNPYSTHHALAPTCVEMEREIIAFFLREFRMPPSGYGLLTTGSSLAIVSALHAARKSKIAEKDWNNARIYVSQQGHHASAKAAHLLGFGSDAVRKISTTNLQLNLAELQNTIENDRKNGFIPLVIVGTAGTTNTGAIDDLSAIAQMAREQNCWFHVDGAYGAPHFLTAQGKICLKGMELADSLNFDFHKSLSMPYGTGCLLVKDANTLLYAQDNNATYMPPHWQGVGADPADLGPELSRDFRAFRVWFPLRARGLDYYRNQLAKKQAQAQALYDKLKTHLNCEIVAPTLTVVALHCGNETKNMLEKINSRGNIFLSGCTIANKYYIRVAILSYLCEDEDIDFCADEIIFVIKSVIK